MASRDPPYFKRVMSAAELRSELTQYPCCSKNCCVNKLFMPIDFSVNSWSINFIGSSKVTSTSDDIHEFEAFIMTLRSATAHLRRNTNESEQMLSEFLRQKFMDKFNGCEWIYDIMHPMQSRPVEVCRRAWISCFGVTLQKLRFAQQCVKENVYISPKTKNVESVTLKDAFKHFGLDLLSYRHSFDNFMDISKISETEGSQVAAVWLSSEFDLIGEAQPDENVILIDIVDENDVYERYRTDERVIDLTDKILSYSEFTRIWREVFPKVS